jgi:cell division protein FtsI (penicillin-binding protein 3)
MLALLLVIGVLLLRAIYLEVFQQEDLQKKSDQRQLREVVVPAYRGMILDRNGEPMAISTPVESIKCEPKKLLAYYETLRHDAEIARQGPTAVAAGKAAEDPQGVTKDKSAEEQQQARDAAAGAFTRLESALHTLEQETGLVEGGLLEQLEKDKDKSITYLGRYLPLETASALLDLDLPGISTERGYRRYYPQVDTAGHVVGMTKLEGDGIEGVEKVRNDVLAGKPGKIRGIIDGRKRLVEQVEQLEEMQPGQDVQLSIDRRIQYLAYKELMTRVYELNAKAGSLVVLDAHTGEILAMVNVPSFNPNNRKDIDPYRYRNRAVTDKAEPGSTLKPLTIAAALEARVIGPDVLINTSPGRINFGKYVVKDHRDYGSISLPTLLAKSSNVGASRVALLMNPRDHWMFLKRLGFGRVPDAGLSGESAGELGNYANWGQVDRAAHGYGYGLSVSLLQMAHAYTAFAAGGLLMPVTIYKVDQPVAGQPVMSAQTARDVVRMMEAVVHKGGTGEKAMVEGYRVAGKTGTAFKHLGKGKGYSTERYMTSFIGIAPASRPRLVVAVQIDEPKVDDSGGKAAAPVFSTVMGEALRLLDIPPDNLPALKQASQPQPQASPGQPQNAAVQGAT